MSATLCNTCLGRRLRPESLAVKLAGWSIADFTALSLSEARPAVDKILALLTPRQMEVAGRPLKEVGERIDFLLAVGLGYLSLERSAATLSGGEAQRIRLATQIGSRLRSACFTSWTSLRSDCTRATTTGLLVRSSSYANLGNTVLVVEHDEETIRRADFVVDLGTRGGCRRWPAGLRVTAGGNRRESAESLTGNICAAQWPNSSAERSAAAQTMAKRFLCWAAKRQ